ncbi:hypothetical protein CPC08DRAFT_141214 [Agrocybe pediades]|nr:hypothetical protein CPC08DRAFT_141214 [Agrocybe pediades]
MAYSSELGSTDSALCPSCTFKTENICVSDIDLQIQMQERRLIPLKIYRNSLAPISRLAPEILCRVFDHLRKIPNLLPFERDPLQWIQATHVCHAWRETALNCPSLWTKLPFEFSDMWTQEMLRRSKSASIYVDLDYTANRPGKPPKLDTALAALGQAMRIYSLFIINAHLNTFETLVKALPRSAPELKTLLLLANSQPLNVRYRLPDEVLNEMNQLRFLEVVGCAISWDNHLLNLRSLTGLRIENILPVARPTADQFFSVLSRLAPTLEHLYLGHTFPSSLESTPPNNLGRIMLPRLQEIRLQAFSSLELERFLDAVSFPSSALVYIFCRDSTGGNIPRAFYNAIQPSLSREDAVVLRDLDITSTPDDDIKVTVKLFAVERSSPGYAYTPPRYTLTFAAKWIPDPSHSDKTIVDNFMVNSILALPLSNVTCMTMQWETEYVFPSFEQTVSDILSPVSRLFFEYVIQHIFAALKEPELSGRNFSDAQYTGILMPNLRHLTIRGLYLGIAGQDELLDWLFHFFIWRKKHGAGVSSFDAIDCSEIPPRQLSIIQGLGIAVKRVGQLQEYEDSSEEEEDEDDEDEQ